MSPLLKATRELPNADCARMLTSGLRVRQSGLWKENRHLPPFIGGRADFLVRKCMWVVSRNATVSTTLQKLIQEGRVERAPKACYRLASIAVGKRRAWLRRLPPESLLASNSLRLVPGAGDAWRILAARERRSGERRLYVNNVISRPEKRNASGDWSSRAVVENAARHGSSGEVGQLRCGSAPEGTAHMRNTFMTLSPKR